MATKHDSTRAQENLWVTQQNLARAKGARPYQQKARKPKVVAPPPAPSTPKATDAGETSPPEKTEG